MRLKPTANKAQATEFDVRVQENADSLRATKSAAEREIRKQFGSRQSYRVVDLVYGRANAGYTGTRRRDK